MLLKYETFDFFGLYYIRNRWQKHRNKLTTKGYRDSHSEAKIYTRHREYEAANASHREIPNGDPKGIA